MFYSQFLQWSFDSWIVGLVGVQGGAYLLRLRYGGWVELPPEVWGRLSDAREVIEELSVDEDKCARVRFYSGRLIVGSDGWGRDLLTFKKEKTAGNCINFCVGKCFFVVLLFSGGVHEQPEEAQEIFEEELIDQLCPPEVCR